MILDLAPTLEAFRVTVEYSNAVLVAVLPYVNDVAQKLDLPVPKPITAAQVWRCGIAPQRRAGEVSAEICINEGWVFMFERGYVSTIQSPRSFFALQDPDQIPSYYGEPLLTRAQAIELGRTTIRTLRIPLELVFAEQEPRVTEPVRIGTNIVPHYRIQWLRPECEMVRAVDMEIDAGRKRLARVYFSANKNLERPPPKLGVDSPGVPLWPATNPEYARALVPIVLRAIDEYGKVLSLPIARPLTTNDVAIFALRDNGGWPHCTIDLTNGWRFIFRNSMVNGHYAPDNLFSGENRPILVKQFVGESKLSDQEAAEVVRRSILKFNYPSNLVHADFQPQFYRPGLPGIPRVFVFWNHEDQEDIQSKIEGEVALDTGQIKSLYYDDKAYWMHPPPIDVPITLPTPALNPAATTNGTAPSKGGRSTTPNSRLDHPVPLRP